MGLGSTLTRSLRQLSPISMKKAGMQASTHTSPFCWPIVETTLDLWWNVRGVLFLWRERTLPLNRSRGARECPSIPACMSNSSRWTSCQKSRNSPTQRWHGSCLRKEESRSGVAPRIASTLPLTSGKLSVHLPAQKPTYSIACLAWKSKRHLKNSAKRPKRCFGRSIFLMKKKKMKRFDEIWMFLQRSRRFPDFQVGFFIVCELLEAHKSASEPTVWKISASLRCRHFHHCNHHHHRLHHTHITGEPSAIIVAGWSQQEPHLALASKLVGDDGDDDDIFSGAFLFQHIFGSEMRSSLD